MSVLSTRRGFLQSGSTLAGAALAAGAQSAPAQDQPKAVPPRFRFCLNTSTIREQKVGIVREIEIAREAGYDAIEPWMDTLHQYVADGGSLSDLKKRLQDAGLVVPSAIGFAQWIVDDADARQKGLENARRDMDLLAQIGGQRIAAPPVGAQDKLGPDLATISQRYRALLEVGDKLGVVPQCEVWGFSKTLSKLAETAYVVIGANHPSACVLPDVYHLHKGGSGFDGVRVLSQLGMQVFHLNDYPAQQGPDQINDSHRVYPGDGVAPLVPLLRTLRSVGFAGFLSLELFNREYWKQDPLQVAQTGLRKMQAVAQQVGSA